MHTMGAYVGIIGCYAKYTSDKEIKFGKPH